MQIHLNFFHFVYVLTEKLNFKMKCVCAEPEAAMIVEIWSVIRDGVWLKENHTHYGKDVGHGKQQDCNEHHWLCGGNEWEESAVKNNHMQKWRVC